MMSRKRMPEIDELLSNWEEVYKKGLLSFWILLRLHQGPGYAYDIARSIETFSQGTISADENSIYRALNRFESMGILASEIQESEIGPARRYYHLTDRGMALLQAFIRRNLLVFRAEPVRQRVEAVLNGTSPSTEAGP